MGWTLCYSLDMRRLNFSAKGARKTNEKCNFATVAGVVQNSDTSSCYKGLQEDLLWEHMLNVTQKKQAVDGIISFYWLHFFFTLFLKHLWLLAFQPHMNYKLWILFNIITPLYAFIHLYLFVPTANDKFCLVFWAPLGLQNSCMPCANLCSLPN